MAQKDYKSEKIIESSHGKIDLNKYFDYVDIKTSYMESILMSVVFIINKDADMKEIRYGPLIEGITMSGEAGEVTEDGDIRLDSSKLKKLDNDVAMAIIAHELAHSYLGHINLEDSTDEELLSNEREADDLARKWGFDIDKFRSICGPAIVI